MSAISTSGEAQAILIMDDGPANLEVMVHHLERCGYRVLTAQDGAEGIKRAVLVRPDLILLDVMMPGMDGFETCRQLKAIEATRDIPVIFMTALAETADKLAGFNAGGVDYVTKPVQIDEVLARVKTHLALRTVEKQLAERNAHLQQEIAVRQQAEAALRREHAEREQAEAMLRQSQKMEAVGQLTGGIAHDFNNLLTVILGGLYIARLRLRDARTVALLDGACRAAEHGAELVAKLLAFSRNQRLTLEPIDIGALLAAMLPLLEKTTGPTIRLTCECAPDVWPALADPHQIELVLLNLAINARDAMPRGGTLAIRAANVTSDEPASPAEMTGSDCVMVTVADTGVGMSEETRSRVFEPFFTTKDVGKGSGLGLSMVQGVTKQCGGAVTIESAIARGTTVRVFLPRAVQRHTDVGPARSVANSHPAAAAAILLVEDDPDVRGIAALTLREAGHDVDEAASGPEALDKMQRGSVPHLLISDLAMPDMTGVELIIQAQALYPELRAIIITGFAEHAALSGIPGSVPILNKPFRPGELQRVANTILSERQTATGPQHP